MDEDPAVRPPHDGMAIAASRREPRPDDPALAVLERMSRQIDSIRKMLVFFVWLSLIAIVLGGIAYIAAVQAASDSTPNF